MEDSEFKTFLDTLKRLGIPFMYHYMPTKEEWQQRIIDAGHNFTALACTVIIVNGVDFLFLNQGGVFIMSHNARTGEIEHQNRLDSRGKKIKDRRIVHFTGADQTYDDLCAVDERAR